ncbi:MAG: FecR family protein [Verrucomicrobia bacterium]|nr:FecR family protein [Verrucomicrobiota bacterium]
MKASPTFGLIISCSLALGLIMPAYAGGFSKAEITRLTNEVQVLKGDAAPKAAIVGQSIDPVSTVATGNESRAELRFPDKTLTRLGANSRFTLRGEARTLDLNEGTMMLQVPKNQGGAKVRTAGVTAAVTGTTVLIEYHPGGVIKLIVVEGECTIFLNNDRSEFKTLKAGEMIEMQDGSSTIPEVQTVDLKRLLETSKLISSKDQNQPNQEEIDLAVAEQEKLILKGDLVKGNLLIQNNIMNTGINTNAATTTNLPPMPMIKPDHGGGGDCEGPGGGQGGESR